MSPSHIQNLVDREYFGMKLGLQKIQAFLKRWGQPQRHYPSIHIAGTNGKGSTAIMISRILEAAGYRVGLFSSPHLRSYVERFQINGAPIDEGRLEELSRTVQRQDAKRLADRLSFFECMTAIAFQYFAEEKVDVAVVEVGLGGRLDATNVLRPAVSVITPIHLDHQLHLGPDLISIAREKAGIIKKGIPVVSAAQRSVVRAILVEIAGTRGAPLTFADSPITMHADGSFSFEDLAHLWLPVLGSGQVINACTAVKAALNFTSLPRRAIYQGLAASYLPGRMEIARRQPLVLLDGAHNPEAISHLVQTVREQFPGHHIRCLFTAMRDKDVPTMLETLRALQPELHLTTLGMKRALPLDELAAIAQRLGFVLQRHESAEAAVPQLLHQTPPQDLLLVTGSFFLVGAVRDLFR